MDGRLAEDIFLLKSKDKKNFTITEDIVSLSSLIDYIHEKSGKNQVFANKELLAGRRISKVLGECNV